MNGSLQAAHKNQQVGLSFLFLSILHLMGPAKSVPMTSNAVPTVVQSSDNWPGTGIAAGVVQNLLQPKYLLCTDLTTLQSLGTQYFSCMAAIVKPTPPWSIWWWTCWISFSVNLELFSKYTGVCPCIRPWHVITPFALGYKLSCH